MINDRYYRESIETMERDALDDLIDERTRYTIQYANDHSPFYRHWFKEHGINPLSVRTHEDLLGLPLISGADIRAHQPPNSDDFEDIYYP
jgi:phenylacetate-coenzyme A ligase PaaK-like adenylate-forming protein